jgi:hypothetical protein
MRKLVYTVTTPQSVKYETTSLAQAEQIKAEQGGSIKARLEEIKDSAPQISPTKLEWLKSGAKPLHPYKGV